MTHMVDSLLALSSGSNYNTIELSGTGQGEMPRKKDQARELQQRIEILKRLLMISNQSRKQFEAKYSLDDNTSVKINYVKQMMEAYNEANDILDTLNVNDRYKNIEKGLEKLEILLYKNWEDEHGDKMMEAYNEIIFFFTTSDRTSTQKNIINTQETKKKYYFVHADNTHSEKETDNTHNGKGTRIHDNKSNDKPLDNVPEACKFKDCKFKTKIARRTIVAKESYI